MKQKIKVEQLYHAHRRAMFAEAFEILKDKALAEDAVSESFVRIIHHLDKIDCVDSTNTRNFLKVICRNVAMDMYRKKRRENEFISAFDADILAAPTAEDLVLDRESVNRIVDIIAHMDNIYKDVLILNRIYNLKIDDISLLFGISPAAVTKRLQRAKAEIKNKLAKEEA